MADLGVDIILTTGGTGFTARDVTPRRIRPLLGREMDGFPIVFHGASLATVGVSTLQSRALAGQIGETFIFCIPGSTGACRDAWDFVLSLELDSRHRPCSLAGQVPRSPGCAHDTYGARDPRPARGGGFAGRPSDRRVSDAGSTISGCR